MVGINLTGVTNDFAIPRNMSNIGAKSVCYAEDKGLFVAVGTTGRNFDYSFDGITWNNTNDVSKNSIVYAADKGLFVAVGISGACVNTSQDGITWNDKNMTPITAQSVCYAAQIKEYLLL